MNKIILIGRLVRDPELRYTQNSIPTASFTLAVNRNFKNANGEYDADFIPIVAWRGLAETLSKHLKKGARVAVSGRIQTRSYDGNDGQKRYVTEVIADDATIFDWNNANNTRTSDNELSQIPQGFMQAEDDDDIPF